MNVKNCFFFNKWYAVINMNQNGSKLEILYPLVIEQFAIENCP